jgi:hypothetical protein
LNIRLIAAAMQYACFPAAAGRVSVESPAFAQRAGVRLHLSLVLMASIKMLACPSQRRAWPPSDSDTAAASFVRADPRIAPGGHALSRVFHYGLVSVLALLYLHDRFYVFRLANLAWRGENQIWPGRRF